MCVWRGMSLAGKFRVRLSRFFISFMLKASFLPLLIQEVTALKGAWDLFWGPQQKVVCFPLQVNLTLVPVTLQVGTILQIYTCPPLLQAAIQLGSSHQGISPFLSHLLSFSRISRLCSPASAFFPSGILCHLLMNKPQPPMHRFLPAHWSWPPQSCFQSLNTGVACGETDSCYPVLRKTFRQSKSITSVTSIAWSHSILLPHRNPRHHHQVNFVFAPKLPRGMQHARFPSFTTTTELQACF